jgi:hypothetical protein
MLIFDLFAPGGRSTWRRPKDEQHPADCAEAAPNFIFSMQAKCAGFAVAGTPARLQAGDAGAGQIVFSAVYLRAAQAYMLISMPTGTSTIFGVFQVIWGPPTSVGAMLAPKSNVGLAQEQRKCGTTMSELECGRSDSRFFPLGQGHFSLGQGAAVAALKRRSTAAR